MIVDLHDERAKDPSLTGGKGSKLADLIAGGFPVPAGFVITTRAFAAFLDEVDLASDVDRLLGTSSASRPGDLTQLAESIQDRIRASRVPDVVATQLGTRLKELNNESDARWAVRSSALAEDLSEASFAGQYDTVLGVAAFEEVANAVLRCWASFFNVHALQYRRDRGIADFRGAVVVQRLIEADAAGVCFTSDPVTGANDRVVINSSFGLGESVVSGQVTPDTFVLDKSSFQLISRGLSSKEIRIVAAAEGVRTEQIDESTRREPSITDDQAMAVARLAAAVELAEKRPVDVEWAFRAGEVYLLQSRPITTLPSGPESTRPSPPDDWEPELNTPIDPRYPLYSSGNLSEVLPGCTTPLSWSYIGPTIEHAFRSQGMALGAMDKAGAEYQVLGFFYHRPYICVSFMEATAARTPGMSPDQIHEEFIGPPEKRTPPLTLSDLRPDRWPAIPRVAMTFLRKTRSLASHTSECDQLINRLRDESTPEMLKSWPDERLTEQVLLPGKLTWISDVHIWASTFAVVYFTLLRKLAEKWLGDADGSLAARMVTGIGTLPSADPAFGLYGLAEEVLRSPEVRKHFDSIKDDRHLLETLREDQAARDFNAAFEEFLRLYGHRAVCEAELRNPCWREDPAQVLGLVRNYLSPDVTSPEELRARQDRVSTKAASQIDGLALPKRVLLRRVLKAARRYIGLRERLKDFIVLRSDWARQVYAEICQRLLARGLLSDRDDLYFLQSKEVGDLLRGQLEPDTAREIISRRRKDFEWSQMVHLPKILHGEARPVTADDFTAGGQLRGMGVSPGRIEGRARVILDPRVDSHIEPGEILVAPVTDAGWTPLFINAAGLVVDVGGLLSHGSVVAREYGLPAVVGATGATKQIKTGDRIYLDGSSGVVIKLD